MGANGTTFSRLRAAFFDFGDTLVEAPPGEDHWRPVVMARIERAFGAFPWGEALYDADIRRLVPDDPHRQDTNRWISEWLRDRGEIWAEPDVDRLRRALASPLPDAFTLAPGAQESLRWCKTNGLAVAILTNTITRGDDEVWRDCRRLGLDGLIDEVVSSYSTGWAKPHTAMFERALSSVGVRANEAFMVGDQLGEDVLGAKRSGLRAVWIRRRAIEPTVVVDADAVVGSLLELPHVAREWL